MPSRHLVLGSTCSAINAFNPSAALVAAFLNAPKRRFSRASTREDQDRQEHGLPGAQQLSEDSIQLRKVPIAAASFRKHSLRRVLVEDYDNVSPKAEVSSNRASESEGDRTFRKSWQLINAGTNLSERKARALARHEQAKSLAATQPELAQRLNARNDNLEAVQTQQQSPAELEQPSMSTEHWSETLVIDPANARFRSDKWKKNQRDLATRAHELSQLKLSPHETKTIKLRQSHLDYTAMYIDVPDSPMSAPHPIPWLSKDNQSAGKNAMELLDAEIENFARWMDCTPMETAARTSLAQQMINIINNNANRPMQIKQFGSNEVGLATILSDIDIRLSFREQRSSAKHGMTNDMQVIKSTLSNHADFVLASFRNARYPIVNAQHKPTGIDIQIVGSPDTNAQREAMSHYLNTIPQLRSVYMVLKTALGIRGLVDVFNGGIGSYGLFMMLVASLQRPHSNPPRTAAESLLRFLNFYSDLNIEKYGVSVSPPKLFKKHDVFTTATKSHIAAARRRGDKVRAAQWAIGQRRIYQPYLFCLQDPANPLNDLGRKSNAIKHLQTTIRVFRNTIRKYLSDAFPGVPSPVPWRDGSLLLPLVGRCHEIYYERRARAEMQGRIAVEAKERKAIEESEGLSTPMEREVVKDDAEGRVGADLEKEIVAA